MHVLTREKSYYSQLFTESNGQEITQISINFCDSSERFKLFERLQIVYPKQ